MKPWMIWLLALVAIAVTIWAARAEESAPLPQITVEQQRDYHRARAALLATPQQRALDDIIAGMQAVCGDRGLIADSKGNPVCGVKAQPAEKAK